MMKFSVIVPVYNGEEIIELCLDALANQGYPSEDYETTLVNDGSTDRTREIADGYPVRLINLETNQGLIVARETGARAANYDLLVFNDVRAVPDSNHLRNIDALGYQPVNVGYKAHDKRRSPFDRLFYVLWLLTQPRRES